MKKNCAKSFYDLNCKIMLSKQSFSNDDSKEMSYSDKIQYIEKEILLSSYSFADMPEIDSSI